MKQLFFALALTAAFFNPLASHSARADGGSDLAYYQQFFYSSSEDADGNVSTKFLMQTFATKPADGQFANIPLGSDGSVLADISIFLVSDGSYVVEYNETKSNGFPIVMLQHYFGQWSVPGQQLLLGDFATGVRAVDYQGQNSIQLTFLKDLNTPGLAGKSGIYNLGFSNEPLPQQ